MKKVTITTSFEVDDKTIKALTDEIGADYVDSFIYDQAYQLVHDIISYRCIMGMKVLKKWQTDKEQEQLYNWYQRKIDQATVVEKNMGVKITDEINNNTGRP